uniref:Uncharacterized protein n=1 Tax=Arundo donax TaxID=35708 RepID=A0A0A9C0K6_ARUDO
MLCTPSPRGAMKNCVSCTTPCRFRQNHWGVLLKR